VRWSPSASLASEEKKKEGGTEKVSQLLWAGWLVKKHGGLETGWCQTRVRGRYRRGSLEHQSKGGGEVGAGRVGGYGCRPGSKGVVLPNQL